MAKYINTDVLEVVGFTDQEGSFSDGVQWLLEYIDALPSADVQPVQRWIPCSERLPEKDGEYICTMQDGQVQECGFVPTAQKGLIPGWSTCEADGYKFLRYEDVIAWMPLPEPYEEESENKK